VFIEYIIDTVGAQFRYLLQGIQSFVIDGRHRSPAAFVAIRISQSLRLRHDVHSIGFG